MVFLDPTTDIAFKKLFGDQAKKEIVICFLNSILDRQEGEKIIDVTITDPYNHPDTEWLKMSIVDVRCVDQQQRNYIIEVQVSDQDDYAQRSQYYASLAIARQIKKGAEYTQVMPVIFVGILDFKLFPTFDYLSHHRILNTKSYAHDLRHLEFHFIELPKFEKTLEQLETVVEKWVYLLKNASNLDSVPKQFQQPLELEEAMDALKEGNLSPAELDVYDRVLDARRVAASIKRTGERIAREKGLEDGRQQGRQQGRQEGRQEGIEKNKQETARKMLDKGLSIETIVEITGLLPEEIKKLR